MNSTENHTSSVASALLEVISHQAKKRMLLQELLSLQGLRSEDIYKVMRITEKTIQHTQTFETMYRKYMGCTTFLPLMEQGRRI